jgi:hypothetical protein
MLSEKIFKEYVSHTVEVLKETYVGNIIYVQERMKKNANEEELKQIEDIILATERMIVYFEKSDDWVKKLHEDAKNESGGGDYGTDTIDGELESRDNEEEIARIETARNS